MSDYSSVAPPQNNSHTAAFAAALQRARLIAAKIDGGGSKRPLEDGQEPSPKKVAGLDGGGFQTSPGMSGATAATAAVVTARVNANAQGAASGPPPQISGPVGMVPGDLSINDYIRVPDKMVGLIIGRGGEQIMRLQAESGCKIQMAPDSGGAPDRVCTLTGTRESVAKAKEMVNSIVNQRGRENGPSDGMGGGGGGGGGPPMGMGMGMGGGGPPRGPPGGGGGMGQNYEEIMIPGPKVGLVIGKGGETIKQLQEKCGAKMVIIQDGPNPEYEKPLRITGDPQKVEYAKQLVFELIAEKDMQYGGGGGMGGPRGGNNGEYQGGGGPMGPGGAEGLEVLVPRAAVGVVIGKGGDMIKKIQAETGARVQFHQGRDEGPGDRRCYLQGKSHKVEQARQMIQDLIDSVNNSSQRRGGDQEGGGGRGGPQQRNGGDFQPQWGGPGPQEHKVEVSFTVSNMKCGIIIGRGGEVIKQINAMSGAHCELDRRTAQNNRGNRTFFIRGDPEAVEAAKRIISEKVGMPINFVFESGNSSGNSSANASQAGDYYGGGGGGGGGGMGGPPVGPPGGPPGGGAPAWGYNPHWHPAQQQQHQPQPQPSAQPVQINPSTGQPDYSQQWIDYYRSLGMVREAEAVELQVKASKQQMQPSQQAQGQNSGAGGMPVAGGVPMVAAGGGAAPAGVATGAAAGAAAAAAGTADYSAQWAEYYRSIGKIKEAEAIEDTMKQKSVTSGGGGGGAPMQAAVSQQSMVGGGGGAGAPYAAQPGYGGQPAYAAPTAAAAAYAGYAAAYAAPAYATPTDHQPQ